MLSVKSVSLFLRLRSLVKRITKSKPLQQEPSIPMSSSEPSTSDPSSDRHDPPTTRAAAAPPTNITEDTPGTRSGPEDEPWAQPYEVLNEVDMWREMAAFAKPQSVVLDHSRGQRVDAINFQPCSKASTQDRYIVTQLDIHGRTWTLTGVFDGHVGDATVEHTAFHLPMIIRDFLREAFAQKPVRPITPAFISELLSRSMTSFDEAIAGDVLDLFPGGLESLSNYSDEEISRKINDIHQGGVNYQKARLCMYGTTALVALVDPDHENLWLANLGDCQGVMVTQITTDDWKVEPLTKNHDGDNIDEVERVMREHPGEPNCVLDQRVLGAIAPFRCIGDIPFKQPPEFTRRILYNLYPGFQNTTAWERFLNLNHTPPYISSVPEITHRRIARSLDPTTKVNGERPLRFLVLSSDGLAHLCQGPGQQRIINTWARNLKRSIGKNTNGQSSNMALRMLWHALGEENDSVSRLLTLDMDSSWLDDTSIVIQTL